MKVGDLVRMKGTAYDTGLVGIVVGKGDRHSTKMIAIKWIGGSGNVDWEPDSWLEVVSASR